MSVKRNEDGSINITNNNGSMAVGRMVLVSNDKKKENFNAWVENCAKLIKACPHTFKETEKYFLEHCETLPIDPNDRRFKSFQNDVIENYCKDKLKHQPPKFSFDMTDEEIENWKKENDAMRDELRDSSPEQFGLIIHGYYLPHTERNLVYYEHAQKNSQEVMRSIEQKRAKFNDSNHSKPIKITQQDICFFFEETTEHFNSDNWCCNLMAQLVTFRGVTENDIEKRTPRFKLYISTLRHMGKLPDM